MDSVQVAKSWLVWAQQAYDRSPWPFVVLVMVIGFGYLLRELVHNTELTKGILKSLTINQEVQSTVTLIRQDQVLSNAERLKQSAEIHLISVRLGTVENKLEHLPCPKEGHCEPNSP